MVQALPVMRLASIQAEAYGFHVSALDIIDRLTDEELAEAFSGLLEGLLQAGRMTNGG